MGHIGEDMRICDEVSMWVKSLQTKLKESGDLLLEDIKKASKDNKVVEFVKNEEFYKLLSKDKVGYLNMKRSPKEFKLQLITKVPSLKDGAVVECSIEADKISSEELREFDVKVINHDQRKIVDFSMQGSKFTFPVSVGDYECSVTWHGQHVSGSPLTIPVIPDVTADLKELGLAPLDTSSDKDLKVGTQCFAKWAEDNVWYNASIVGKNKDGSYQVLFMDYGNSDNVSAGSIVQKSEMIPQGDDVDENLLLIKDTTEPSTSKFKINDHVIAKWSEDGMWYNAKILSIQDAKANVLFVDYGNEAIESVVNLVKDASEIPAADQEIIDENVSVNVVVEAEKKKELPTIKEEEKRIEFKVGDQVLTKWSEDDIWYNAKIVSVKEASARVHFVDYGNEEEEIFGRIVKCFNDIPKDELNSIDENVEPSKDPPSSSEASKIQSSNQSTAESPKASIIMEKVESRQEVPQKQDVSPKSEVPPTVANGIKEDKFKIGEIVFAKWSEDKVWYKAEILSLTNDGAKVLFKDYGNEENVVIGDMVKNVEEIPPNEERDENVGQPGEVIPEQPSDDTTAPPNVPDDKPIAIMETKTIDEKIDELKSGTVCVAKWDEDEVYYNAKVLKYLANLSKYEVEFIDYGNTAYVSRSDIVMSGNDVPPGQDYDTNVVIEDLLPPEIIKEEVVSTKPTSATFSVGEKCLAKWSEDNTWYNAEIMSADDDGYQVKFVDYGNEDKTKFIARKVSEIPVSDIVDECVDTSAEEKAVTLGERPQAMPQEAASCTPGSGTEKRSTSSPPSSAFGVGEKCFAKWSVDETWYNAEVVAVHPDGLLVHFVDYGNEDKTRVVVKNVSEIPVSEAIDECVDTKPVDQASTTPSNNVVSEDSKVVGKTAEIPRSSGDIGQQGPSKSPTSSASTDTKPTSVVSEKKSSTAENCKPVSTNNISLTNGKTPAQRLEKPSSANVASVQPNGDCPTGRKSGSWKVGDICIARWDEDEVWYNAKITSISSEGRITVIFSDYGNDDQVTHVVRSWVEIPANASVDENVAKNSEDNSTIDATGESNLKMVKTDSSNSCDSGVGDSILGIKTNFLSFVGKKDEKVVGQIAKKKTVIKQLNGPVAVAMLNNETLALVCRNDQSVQKYSRSGKPLGMIKISNRDKFKSPTDILVLKSGKFIIRDGNGLHMFGPNEKYLGKLGPEYSNLYFGIAESDDHIITINVNKSGNNSRSPTEKNEVDLFYFDKETHKIEYRIEMADIITNEMKPLSQCSNPKYRYLTYDEENKKLYVVDMGLDCVYCIFKGADGEVAGGSFGDPGSMTNQFNKPAGITVDEMGSLIVVDSGNNRLQVVDSNWNICGALKVDRPLVRPSGVYFDKENTELWVSNFGDGSVVCYSLKL